MIRPSILLTTGCLCLTPAALAQYNYGQSGYSGHYQTHQNSHCERVRDEKRVIGGLIGAVAGGALGVAIADDGDDYYYSRRHYGHRGYGYRHRYHRSHHYYHHDDGDEIAGALIGGVLGAVVGSELAASGTDCSPKWSYKEVPPPTRQAYGQGWRPVAGPGTPTTAPPRSPGVVYQNDPNPVLYGGPASAAYPAPETEIRVERTSTFEPSPTVAANCRTIQRQTQLPDGNTVLEPVEVCQNASGQWELQPVDELF